MACSLHVRRHESCVGLSQRPPYMRASLITSGPGGVSKYSSKAAALRVKRRSNEVAGDCRLPKHKARFKNVELTVEQIVSLLVKRGYHLVE